MKSPVYVSFVTKATLWERGERHQTAHTSPNPCPALCPRFRSHMKTRPEDVRPPCFPSTKSRPQPLSVGTTHRIQILTAPKTRALEGCFAVSAHRRAQNKTSRLRRHCAVVVPRVPLPSTAPLSSINATPPRHGAFHLDSVRQQHDPNLVPKSPSGLRPAEANAECEDEDGAPQPDEASVSTAEPEWMVDQDSAGPQRSELPGSLSEFSRPPSSLFSRSTDLSSAMSGFQREGTSADNGESDPDCGASFSPRQSSLMSSLGSHPPSGPTNQQSSPTVTNTPPPDELLPVQTSPASPHSSSGIHHPAHKPVAALKSPNPAGTLRRDASVHQDPHLSLKCDHDPDSPASSSTARPKTAAPRSGSRAQLTPSPSSSWSEWPHRWSVLPPVSSGRGRSDTSASPYSGLSCSQSQLFDQLDDVAPQSASCPSADLQSHSSGRRSPATDLSPGLAALTVSCDSGNLGAMSRVQLLLLDRPEPETLPDHVDEEDLSCPPENWTQRGPRSTSPASQADAGGTVESNHPGWTEDVESSDGGTSLEHTPEEKEQMMAERKRKALNMLSKLQSFTTCPSNTSQGRSNFEDFDFLAKYCIFSQEKLDEYKRAFVAGDSDGDGYISCLQVLLALKNIIPPELLSEEQEIYVYRILEMVDFRVTDGLVDLRLFAVIASLAQKIATMDEFMQSLISSMDFRSLEVRLFKAKQLFLFLLEEQPEDCGAQQGFISAEQLLLEVKAGGIHLEPEAALRLELRHIPALDLLDYLAYLPLFMLIHKSVIANPLDDSSNH